MTPIPSKKAESGHPVLTLLLCLLTGTIVWAWQSAGRDRDLAAYESTITAQMEAFGDAMQARGHVPTTADLETAVRESLGKELASEIKRTNGTVQALVVAVGNLKGEDVPGPVIQLPAPLPAPVDLTILQERRGPPLTAVRLVGSGSSLATTWHNNSERFRVAVGEWRTADDGARAALSLDRDVLGSDGLQIGTEKIPITSADAYFSSDMIARTAPMAAWSVFLGTSIDQHSGSRRPAFFIQKHLDRKWAVTTGVINSGAFLGASYTFGSRK